MIEIIDKQNREILSEGRNHGLGFAFCKKLSDDSFETVQPISPCKDYLNDVIAAEKLNLTAQACGLTYVPQKLFVENEPAYLAFKIVGYQTKNASLAKTYNIAPEEVRLHETYRRIQGILNDIEGQLDFKTLSRIERCKDGYFLCTVPYEWITSTYMISLYSLIIRTGQYFTPILRPIDLLMTIPSMEGQLWVGARMRLDHILKTKVLPVQNFVGTPGAYHSTGILVLPLPQLV